MLTSSGTADTIAFFVCWVRDVSPAVRPAVIMSDCDQAQLQALREIYPSSQIWLCIWHVLQAMQSHFSITVFQSLWEKVKTLVKTEDLAKFYTIWDEISTDPSVPPSFVQYMASSWIPASHMWSKVVRKDHPIHLEGDTNMLIKAYVYHLCIDKITDFV
jgi:MULE transposase domain